MKKICFITTISATLKAFVLKPAKYLYENGDYEITVICNSDKEFEKILPDYIRYIPVPMKRGITLSVFKNIIQFYKIFKKEKFDMIQYSTPNASLYASIAGKMAGIKVRLYCQMGLRYIGFSGLKKKIFKKIEKITCKNSTWIEPVSFNNLEFGIKEKLFNKNNSSVVWNGSSAGIDLSKFDIKCKKIWMKEIKEKYKIKDDEIVLGFVGRLDKDKGVDELFLAFKQCIKKDNKIKLLLVGSEDKPETVNKDLYQWAKQNKQVIFTGAVEEVEKYFSAMDIFILPSYREGFGNVIIEAEAMGVPVIVTNIPGPKDAIVSNYTGLMVEKANASELKNAIEKLVYNKELREQMGREGFKFATEKFDDKKLFEYILEDRKKLLDRTDKK